jgi:hypothetical protein
MDATPLGLRLLSWACRHGIPGLCQPWAQIQKPFGLAGNHAPPKPTSGKLSAQDQRPCVFQPTKHPSPRQAQYQSKTNGLASSSPQSTQAHVGHSISPRPTVLRLPAHKAPKPTSGTVSVQDQRSCVFQARVGTTLGKPHHHTAPQGANPTGVVSIMESPESVSPQLDPLTRPPSFLCPTSF